MDIAIKPLSPELLGDFLRFFDQSAFTDNHDWQGCYCRYYQFPGTMEEWEASSGQRNRAAAIELITAGEMKGYLAYCGGEPVGWCSANDKSKYPLLSKVLSLGDAEGARCCSVVCFIVAPAFRRQGISRMLLERVCADCRAQGYDYVEAYPRTNAHTCAHNYHGYPELYLREGFEVAKELDNVLIMRKALR